MEKMSSRKIDAAKSAMLNIEIDPTECPYREFRDSELSTDYWGMGPATLRAAMLSKTVPKPPPDHVWNDDQTQPLPRSVRQYLHGWIRAEDLAFTRWEAEAVIFEENETGKMGVMEMQLSHAQVMLRSSFCRRVLSACFMLERTDGVTIEHQWENFTFALTEGWRARYHIYSPGIKPGGGQQHRPGLSRNGCYLVRLYHLGAWRCVWVSDQVPVDATDSPLLPFSPLISQAPPKPGTKQVTATVTSSVVHLWPLLLCKALLKLAAPDMNPDDEGECVEDETMSTFNLMHSLTGAMELNILNLDLEELWEKITSEVPVFAWDEDDDTMASTIKSKSTKKPTSKETAVVKRGSMAIVTIEDTKNLPPYSLPGITPGHEMSLVVFMARDVPLKKPLPEPEVALWKYYRWVDWARAHGLYEAYDCPRTRFLKVNGLLKLSYAPHLLDVMSTESITAGFREEQDKTNPAPIKKGGKDQARFSATAINAAMAAQQKEELREWVQYDCVQIHRCFKSSHHFLTLEDKTFKMDDHFLPLLLKYLKKFTTIEIVLQKVKVKVGLLNFRKKTVEPITLAISTFKHWNPETNKYFVLSTALLGKTETPKQLQYAIDRLHELMQSLSIIYYPSMFEFTSTASAPPIRITKAAPNRALDIIAPKSAPLYLQIDNAEENCLKLSLSMLHPRILLNSGIPVLDYIEPAYLVLERFEWFLDTEIPMAKAFISTRGYETVEVEFLPGRHFCRLWVHSRMNWHVALLSESTLLLGTRDLIMSAAARECPWVARFLLNLSSAFLNWIRVNRSNTNIIAADREFYKSYQPDLTWDPEVVGYEKHLLHWMFRRALQSLISRRMPALEFYAAGVVLRKYLCDPDFGMPEKPPVTKTVREIVAADPCDCVMPEVEEAEEATDEQLEETEHVGEERPIVDKETMDQLLTAPTLPIVSQVCELATEELPCGVLKDEREKMIRKHEAATVIQAFWRGAWSRKCLNEHVVVSPETLKSLMEHVFGSLDSLSALMNEFFTMFPGAKYAYSVASALSGVYGLQQHSGTSSVTPICKWIPYFQGVFYCHAPVKVHFDVHSTLQFHTVAVYDNDTGLQMPQAYDAHITFDFTPNLHGYTVMGHGTLARPTGVNSEVHWSLTVLTCISDVFHICDNAEDFCKELPLPSATKLHIDEIFLPNRRNILGGIQISVIKQEAVSFRAAATSPDLEMEAILLTTTDGELEEVARCAGKGELYWPYIRLQPAPPPALSSKRRSGSQGQFNSNVRGFASARSMTAKGGKQSKPLSAGGKTTSKSKLKDSKPVPIEPKQYKIEVIIPYGWPLTLAQWKRVDEVRNTQDAIKVEPAKKPASKPTSAKDKTKEKNVPEPSHLQPQPGDAYVELECALVVGGGTTARRDDDRDLEFAAARRSWDAMEPGRNLRGAQIRKEFRAEFLEALPPPPSESIHTIPEEMLGEDMDGEFQKQEGAQAQAGPTPVTESGMLEMSMESEEEALYLAMPELLKDKFIPLYFVPLCTKEITDEESVVMTENMAEAAKAERHMRYEAAIERMHELQEYNEIYVLGRQKTRCTLLEKLFVDSQLTPELLEVFDEREEAIAKETLERTLSANKKKLDAKKK